MKKKPRTPRTKGPRTLALEIQEFLAEQTQLKQSSLKQYRSILGLLFERLRTTPKNVTKREMLEFFNSEKFQNYSVAYQNNLKIIIQKFFKWMGKETSYIKQVKEVETKIDPNIILTKDQVNTLLSHMTVQEQAMVMVLMEGLRVSEMINLRLKHFTTEGDCGTLYVPMSKTSKRPVPLVRATPFVIKWITNHPLRKERNAYLFIHRWGGTWRKYERESIWNKLQKYDDLIDPHIHPHLFRHCSATYDARAKMPDSFILMKHGWKTREMLDRYSHLAGKDVKEKYFEVYGLQKPEQNNDPKNLVDTVQCPRCRTQNLESNQYCIKCGALLDMTRLQKIEEASEELQENYSKDELFQMFQLFMTQMEKKKKKKEKKSKKKEK